MWLGQNSQSTYSQHFFTPHKEKKYSISNEEITDIPAKLKCLDEACMNCVDEYIKNKNIPRLPKHQRMNAIQVKLSHDRKRVAVMDNGRGIPAKNAEGVYLHLMYGENFDDALKKDHVAGQNGVGISLVRIVSNYFRVITHNGKETYTKVFTPTKEFVAKLKDLKYTRDQIRKICLSFDEHGHIHACREIKKAHERELLTVMKRSGMTESIRKNLKGLRGTLVEFELNPLYFNGLDVSFNLKRLRQYLQDIAMTNPGLQVSLVHDDKTDRFEFKKGMEDIFKTLEMPYYRLYFDNKDANNPVCFESFIFGEPGMRLAWVNSNFASLGGSPMEYFENRICDEARKKQAITSYEKKLKTSATRNDVRQCFHIIHNWHILHPRFKSQDKSYLINDLNEEIRKAIEQHLEKLIRKTDLLNKLKAQMEKRTRLKALDEAAKSLRRTNKINVPKLIPATGNLKAEGRMLFIAEGDSAIAGLRPARDPKIHALFPLKGKPLNVKGMALAKAIQNEEIKNLISIIGLPLEGKVESRHALNYEKISVITDADYDGYAIRSLVFNFFFEYWPELYTWGLIYYSSAPLYEVDVINQEKKRKVFYCLDNSEYEALMKKIKKSGASVLRKKRNKGLGETSKSAMKYTVENCLTRVNIPHLKDAQKTQNLWFHKDFAQSRRKTIAEYSQLFFDD